MELNVRYEWWEITTDGLLKRPQSTSWEVDLNEAYDSPHEAKQALKTHYEDDNYGEFVLLSMYSRGDSC